MSLVEEPSFESVWAACNELRKISQFPEELRWLLERVSATQPERILDIGTHYGGTLRFWAHLLRNVQDARLVTVDLGTKWTIQSPEEFPVEPIVILGDSRDQSTIQRVAEFQPYDFLFIDGDHAYESVKADYNNYSPMVRPGGLVGFHDIEGAEPGHFWTELPGSKEEIREMRGMGIGLLRLPG